jgi:hypothetical protein
MRTFLIAGLMGWTVLSGVVRSNAAAPDTTAVSTQLTIPYVPTRQDGVRDLLWLAEVGTNDVLYDLGSGDGRIVLAAVRDCGARRAVGIEIDPQRIRESRENAAKAGVADRVEFIQGDLFTNDFSQASVVVLYLGQRANLDLRAKLVRTVKPGSRIVAHQFGMGEWPRDKELTARMSHFGMFGTISSPFANNRNVPDYEAGRNLAATSTLSMWIVPAPVAGVWRGRISTLDGERELKLALHQCLPGLYGSFQLQGTTNVEGWVNADLWGDHLRFECVAERNDYSTRVMFDGHVRGDTMQGKLAISGRGQVREFRWKGRRDKADFAGTWEWNGSVGLHPVQLKIERRDGKWGGEYLDPGWNSRDADKRETAVTDFYDFGGGFYFTFLVGRGKSKGGIGYGIVADENTGWLIGEAIAESNGITGTVAFYPYSEKPRKDVVVQQGSQPWQPKRVTP